jgi:plasmid stabilization system protein ParE
MPYTITLHPLVEADLYQIGELISDFAGLRIGQSKINEITAFIERLTDFPHIGTIRSDLYPGLLSIPASEKAVVCFVVKDEAQSVFVLCVSYGRADWQARVRERG